MKTILSSPVPPPKEAQGLINGFEVIPAGDRVVTPELVQKLMEESDEE